MINFRTPKTIEFLLLGGFITFWIAILTQPVETYLAAIAVSYLLGRVGMFLIRLSPKNREKDTK